MSFMSFSRQSETEEFTRNENNFNEFWNTRRRETEAKMERHFPGVVSSAKRVYTQLIEVWAMETEWLHDKLIWNVSLSCASSRELLSYYTEVVFGNIT